jgi:hypothetical protein
VVKSIRKVDWLRAARIEVLQLGVASVVVGGRQMQTAEYSEEVFTAEI